MSERRHDPMAQPSAADLLVLADIARVLGETGDERELLDMAARWRGQARQAMRPAALRAELGTIPEQASAFVADLSAQTGSLDKAYRLLGPEPAAPPAVHGGDQDGLIPEADLPVDPRRWTR